MKCEKCIHFEVCYKTTYFGIDPNYDQRTCEDFIDKANTITLPCEVGDTIFSELFTDNGSKSLGIQPRKISEFRLYMCTPAQYGFISEIPITQLGKTIFLTEEQAYYTLEKKIT